jgi:hypothetical protein
MKYIECFHRKVNPVVSNSSLTQKYFLQAGVRSPSIPPNGREARKNNRFIDSPFLMRMLLPLPVCRAEARNDADCSEGFILRQC